MILGLPPQTLPEGFRPSDPFFASRRLKEHYSFLPQQFLYFLPLPQGQGSLRPTFLATFFVPAGPPAALACSRFVSFT